MSKPEWDEAPSDATHWGPETSSMHESWYRLTGESWACVNVDSWKAFKSLWFGLGRNIGRDDLVERSK